MARINLPSTTPLDVAAGLSVAAMITAWPEALSGGWLPASLAAAAVGILLSVPFWRVAQQKEKRRRKSPIGGLIMVMVEGALVAVTLLHLANAALPPGRGQQLELAVTDKYVSTGRRGRRHYHVVTTPVPGDNGRTDHSVGGLFANSGSYADYAVGNCMALRWRPGWWWPVVTGRRAVPCVKARPVPPRQPVLPMAMPGPRWSRVDHALTVAARRLSLPPGGVRLEMSATIDARGAIIRLVPAPDIDAAAFQAVAPLLMAQPGTLANGPGERRLWLTLLPPVVAPAPDDVAI